MKFAAHVGNKWRLIKVVEQVLERYFRFPPFPRKFTGFATKAGMAGEEMVDKSGVKWP